MMQQEKELSVPAFVSSEAQPADLLDSITYYGVMADLEASQKEALAEGQTDAALAYSSWIHGVSMQVEN
ncbi:MAG: hypothetical protein U0X20_02265, partial [Caldilineaceae bacterium]